jgi:hypothetical protein
MAIESPRVYAKEEPKENIQRKLVSAAWSPRRTLATAAAGWLANNSCRLLACQRYILKFKMDTLYRDQGGEGSERHRHYGFYALNTLARCENECCVASEPLSSAARPQCCQCDSRHDDDDSMAAAIPPYLDVGENTPRNSY